MDQNVHVKMIQPFTNKDFAIRSLADRIKDLTQCVTLYPDIPKDMAFGKYYTPLGGKYLVAVSHTFRRTVCAQQRICFQSQQTMDT